MADLTARIIAQAVAQGQTIATAESCTGGMIAARLTDIAGSSAVFLRGYVTYANAAKIEDLGVSPASLTDFGAVSEAVAIEMAMGARARAQSDFALSVTGIAGPGGSDFKPEGRVCFALAGPAGCAVQTVEFGALGRSRVRQGATDHGLSLIARALGITP